MRKIIIGARGSTLSLVQADIIKNLLEHLDEPLTIALKIITTKGDKDMSPVPLDSVGKGWFTKEIDKALLTGSIDAAVHSLKDVPEVLPDGLVIAAIPKREDAREAFISRGNKPFAKIEKSAVIGTDSTRRKAQILFQRPDLIVKSLRGNVNTRLEKLDRDEYNGIFLAVAGIKRLGLAHRITESFSETEMIPSPGQGALAVIVKEKDTVLFRLLQKINHLPTVQAVKAERAFSYAFGGGCKIPVGAFASCSGKKMTLYGFVGSVNGKQQVIGSLTGSVSSPKKIGKALAVQLMKKSKPWFAADHIKYVVITRQVQENKVLQKKLEALGLTSYSYPTIAIRKKKITKTEQKHMRELSSFDWILFTSCHGVRYFMETLTDLGINKDVFEKTQIGTVGPTTANEVKKYGLSVSVVPQEFTSEHLGNRFNHIQGKKFLLPRAEIATNILPKLLKEKGAHVVEIPVYKTDFAIKLDNEFEQLLENDQIACLTFTSPSTVMGFLKSSHRKKVYALPVISIGPVTAKTAKEQGFTNVVTADTFTTEGLLTKVKEIVL